MITARAGDLSLVDMSVYRSQLIILTVAAQTFGHSFKIRGNMLLLDRRIIRNTYNSRILIGKHESNPHVSE